MRDNTNREREGQAEKRTGLTRRTLGRTIGTSAFATPFLFGTASGSTPDPKQNISDAKAVSEPWRPEYHFSPDQGWMNDPNGLVYHDGVYYLFYQAGEWPRRWDLATSTDLFNWTEHGTVIPATDKISPFSGGADMDKKNTTGFGTNTIVCMYTGHHIETGIEDQRIAYSTDNGETIKKYDGNPVISSEHGDFRDPNPFWYEPDQSWRMVVGRISGIEGRPAGTEIWSSDNALDWTYESTYRSGGGGWECPDLFELPVQGSDETKWVLIISPIETRGVEYHVGEFTGTEFNVEQKFTADYGYDFYATQKWSNLPGEVDRGLHLGWMDNWNYAMEETPQESQSIPRTIQLQEAGDAVELRQSPAEELIQTHEEQLTELDSVTITPTNASSIAADVAGRTLDLDVTIAPQDADQVGLRVREGTDQETVFTYDTEAAELRFDRTDSGPVFEDGFFGTESAPLELRDDGTIQLRVLVDRSSVEVYGNGGRRVMTNVIFPDWDSTGVSFFVDGGTAELQHFEAHRIDVESNEEPETRSAYQIDLIAGEVEKRLGQSEDDYYGRQNRLIQYVHVEQGEVVKRDTWINSLSSEIRNCVTADPIKVSDNAASTELTVDEECEMTLSLAAYTLPNGEFDFENAIKQRLVDSTTRTLDSGTHTLTLDL